MMEYFKIFSTGKQQWWSQDGLAYTDEQHAGFWPESSLGVMGLDETQTAVLTAVDGCSNGESERIELRRERNELWQREINDMETETILPYNPAWMHQIPQD